MILFANIYTVIQHFTEIKLKDKKIMETINHEYYVSLKVAKLLRDAGFDWRCRKCYNNGVLFDMESDEIRTLAPQHSSYDVLAPTIEVAQRWLREVKSFDIYVCPTNGLYFVHIRKYLEPVETKCEYSEYPNQFVCHTYEEAQEAGIKKALEMILEIGE